MPIPHAQRAEVDLRKLRDYCLDLDHEEGKTQGAFIRRGARHYRRPSGEFARSVVGDDSDERCEAGAARRVRAALYGGLLVRMAWEAGNDSEWVDH